MTVFTHQKLKEKSPYITSNFSPSRTIQTCKSVSKAHLKVSHILSNMLSHDVVSVHISIEFLCLAIVARESLAAVRDVQTTISSSFQSAEDTGSSGSSHQTHIQERPEWSWLVI